MRSTSTPASSDASRAESPCPSVANATAASSTPKTVTPSSSGYATPARSGLSVTSGTAAAAASGTVSVSGSRDNSGVPTAQSSTPTTAACEASSRAGTASAEGPGLAQLVAGMLSHQANESSAPVRGASSNDGDEEDEGGSSNSAAARNNPWAALDRLNEASPPSSPVPDVSVVAEPPAGLAAVTCSSPSAANAKDQAANAAAAESLRLLCTCNNSDELVAAAWRLSGGSAATSSASSSSQLVPFRLQPRGLVNTGNSCFVNSTLQALLASSHFCSVLTLLRTAAPLLDPKAFPALHSLALFGAEFEGARMATPGSPSAQGGADSPYGGSEEDGWSEVPRGGRKGRGPVATFAGSTGTSSSPAPAPIIMLAGGKALVPSMLNDLVRKFSPRQAAAAATAATGIPQSNGKMSLAQRLTSTAVAAQEQEDAQEFFQFLVDAAHEELVQLKKVQGSEEMHGNGCLSAAASEEWAQVGRKNRSSHIRGGEDLVAGRSPLSAIFCGALKSTVKSHASTPSATVQPFFLLHLDITNDSVTNVEAALRAYTAPETVHGYKTQAKGSKEEVEVEATKTQQLFKLPEVLVLHLLRYVYTGATGSTKVHKTLELEPVLKLRRGLLAEDCPDAKSGAEYKLVATVSHHGKSLSGGHYTSDVLQPDNRWLRFNDAAVEQVNADKVLAEKPYLLFYQRQH